MTSKDVVSGLVTAIVMIATTLSYSALVFSGPLAADLSLGIGSGLLSAGVVALVFAFGSRLPFAISGPDSKPTAVLVTLAASLSATLAAHGVSDVGITVFIALVCGTLISGLALFALGAWRAGRHMRFIPYPVIGGFLAASGWQLFAGSVRMLSGQPLTLDGLGRMGEHESLLRLGVGAGLLLLLELVRRIKHPAIFPAFLLLGGAAVHLGLHAAGYSLEQARTAGWLLDLRGPVAFPAPWFTAEIRHFHWAALGWAAGGYVALIAVTAITLLLGTIAVEVSARVDLDVDHELRVNGVANILSGLGGGMVGTLSVSRTLFNYNAGARSRASGLIVGGTGLLVLCFGTGALGYVPVPILTALLMQLGLSMLDEWLVKGWQRMQRADYLQVLTILLVIVWWDFVVGVAVGVVAACVTFAISSSRIRLVKLGLSRGDYGSRVDRPPSHHEQLLRYGNGIQIMWLHGFVFFGSANRLLMHVKEIVAAQGSGVCRTVLLDFREVLGIDSSAVLSLIKLRHLAERERFMIVLSALPPQVLRALRFGGLLGDDPAADETCKLFPNLDAALEWSEDRLLEEHMTREEVLRSADEWLAREIGSAAMFRHLVSYLEVFEYAPGDTLFAQGEISDSLSLLYAGRVTVVYRTPQGADLRLRSIVRHTIVGEMGLYRSTPRGASVVVDQHAIVYRLSREALAQMEEDNPRLAYEMHKFVIRTLAARLEFANREVASLQR
jgi:SulP family sulfate permease